MYRLLSLALIFLFIGLIDSDAQRRQTSYESLLQRTDQPSSYIDHVLLPERDGTTNAAFIFRLDHDLIAFLRKRDNMRAPSPGMEFFAPLRMGLEIFEGTRPESRRESRSSVSVFRETWQDTVWVETFEETKSRFNHVEGLLKTTLAPGDYHYSLQLSRGGSVREQSSSLRNLKIHPKDGETGREMILLSSLEENENGSFAELLNFGSSVLYGQNYTVLISLPDTLFNSEETNFYLDIHRQAMPGDGEEWNLRQMIELTNDHLIRISNPEFSEDKNRIGFSFTHEDDGALFAAIEVPNSELENSRFRLSLMRDDAEEPLSRRIVNSQWLDMPVSLYNLDVAIDMMRFILTDEQLREMKSGSSAARESKFRQFWKERDPTPDTEFNELLAEYFRRIDHAYARFTTFQNPGFDTDQGRAYIIYGPPLRTERRLPANAPARELWEYPGRTLIFEATTGFGDFRLISEN
ncbi:MAG: GWxTD domain-containing protein [Balneolaceae bacterium]|nr:MAG: GWxTD domain-containing protein [Balneolaceae bacterium]